MAQSLRVSEIMYHPLDTGNPNDPNTEFLELTNIANQSINLNLVRFTNGIDYTFPELRPARRRLLSGRQGHAPLSRPGTAPSCPWLGNTRAVWTMAASGSSWWMRPAQIIESFQYEDNWFKTTDGQGFSLTVKDPQDKRCEQPERQERLAAQHGRRRLSRPR